MELTSNERTIIELLRSDPVVHIKIAEIVIEKLSKEVQASKDVLDEELYESCQSRTAQRES